MLNITKGKVTPLPVGHEVMGLATVTEMGDFIQNLGQKKFISIILKMGFVRVHKEHIKDENIIKIYRKAHCKVCMKNIISHNM